jgi:hypothetical protein
MADKTNPEPQIPTSLSTIDWDHERTVHQLDPLEVHLRTTTMYIPSRMKEQMDRDHGKPVVALRTKTFPETGMVWLSTIGLGTPGARMVRAGKTLGTAEFGFGIPLRKLGLKLPVERQFNFKVLPVTLEDGGIVYEISFAEAENLPRDVHEALLAAAKQAKAVKIKSRRAKKLQAFEASNGGADKG